MKTKLLKNPLIYISLTIILILLIFSILTPFISSYEPSEINVENRLSKPSFEHLLGTDQLGRDIFTRLMHGARYSMGSVFIILICIIILSLIIGSIAGYFGGAIDNFLMRICDVFMTFPTFVLAMFLIGILGSGMTNVIIAIVLTHWAWYSRIIRSIIINLKNRDYVMASKVAGTNNFFIIIKHFLPAIFIQLLVLASMDIGHMILHVSGLSFLGMGIQPPTPEWGVMINDGRQFIRNSPGLIFFPGCMIFLSVMAFNLLGDAMRDYLDPAVKEKLH